MIRFGKSLLELARRFHLPRHSNQRIFRRQIAVRRRIQRRPLNVRIVVRASGGEIHQPNSISSSNDKKRAGSVRSDLRRIERIHAESPAIGNRVRSYGSGIPGPSFAVRRLPGSG